MRESPRTRRLKSDLRLMTQLQAESSIITFEAHAALAGVPEAYIVRFAGRGVWRPVGTPEVALRDRHEVVIRLGANYPRMMPEISWRSPIFHPNISSSGFVCLGGYGTFWAPSLHLDELCVMLWDMIRFKNFDVNSPYNREAALWARSQQAMKLPLDPRPLRDLRINGASTSTTGSRNETAASTVPEIMFLDDVVEAEVVSHDDQDLLIIQ